MQTIALPDLHRFLLTEACEHTRVWLRALRQSPAREALLEKLEQAKAMIPRIGTGVAVADEARSLAHTIEMHGFGAGGNSEMPSNLWPEEFARNPWEQGPQIRWARWNLRRDSFQVLISRLRHILRSIEYFDAERQETHGCGGKIAPGYMERYRLAKQLVAPDLRPFKGRVNTRAVRPTTPVDWLHVENIEGAKYDDEELLHIWREGWERGLRGVFFARASQNVGARVALCKPFSDMRLISWDSHDPWEAEVHYLPSA